MLIWRINMNDESTKRIYPKLSKEETDKQWNELQEKYKKGSGVNFGEIIYPRKLTIVERIKLFFNVL